MLRPVSMRGPFFSFTETRKMLSSLSTATLNFPAASLPTRSPLKSSTRRGELGTPSPQAKTAVESMGIVAEYLLAAFKATRS